MARRRTGLTLIRGLAFTLCRTLTFWTPAIAAIYGSNPLLILALEAANTACGELVAQADEVLTIDP